MIRVWVMEGDVVALKSESYTMIITVSSSGDAFLGTFTRHG